jgi:FAD/FMN-containing dehydrogenase
MVSEPACQNFRSSLRGQSFCPGEQGYDAARTVPNAMIKRRPAIVARCAGPADVVTCVRFAREHDVLVSLRGGGHSVAGKSVCEGGLMIDLSAMKGIRVDPTRRTVRAEAGLTLGEFDGETQTFGLATTLGTVSKTGISGLTLGAGWGHLHGSTGWRWTTYQFRRRHRRWAPAHRELFGERRTVLGFARQRRQPGDCDLTGIPLA